MKLKHKGYEIRETTFKSPVSSAQKTTYGIYDCDRLVSMAASVAIAKRAIDAHTRSGIWKKMEDSNGET